MKAQIDTITLHGKEMHTMTKTHTCLTKTQSIAQVEDKQQVHDS